MINWIKSHIKEEDRFGVTVTTAIHIVLLIIALLYHFSIDAQFGPASVDVILGEFRTGTVVEQADVQTEQVATRPDPPPVEPDDPDPDIVEPVDEPQPEEQPPVRPVDLPDQEEEIQDDNVIQTPEVQETDPEVTETAEPNQNVVLAPPMARRANEVQQGAPNSGDVDGETGEVNVDEGEGRDAQASAPYSLDFEGDLDRTATIQPLPENTQNVEATIQVRFEVRPDGSVGQTIPIQKMNPELEAEVVRALRSWRFVRLPAGVPQTSQWGVVTFYFVFD